MFKYLLGPLVARCSLSNGLVQRIQPLCVAANTLPSDLDPQHQQFGVAPHYNETEVTKILQVINGINSVQDLLVWVIYISMLGDIFFIQINYPYKGYDLRFDNK